MAVDGESVGHIDHGLLVFLGLDRDDDPDAANRMLDKLLAYRVFPDEQGRMNRSVADIQGGILLVSQFTLSADTRKGLRQSFSSAMPPEEAGALLGLAGEIEAHAHDEREAGSAEGADDLHQGPRDGGRGVQISRQVEDEMHQHHPDDGGAPSDIHGGDPFHPDDK